MRWPSGSSSSAARPRPDRCPTPRPRRLAGAAAKVQEVASKGLAAAKGPLHAIRGTGEAEKMLKNAKTEFFNEHEEIATYHAIQTLAEAVGDKDTAKLAKAIRREEERMASFLERQITRWRRPWPPRRSRRPSVAAPARRAGARLASAKRRRPAHSAAKPAAKEPRPRAPRPVRGPEDVGAAPPLVRPRPQAGRLGPAASAAPSRSPPAPAHARQR